MTTLEPANAMPELPNHFTELSSCSVPFPAAAEVPRRAAYSSGPHALDPVTCELVLIAVASSLTQMYQSDVPHDVDAALRVLVTVKAGTTHLHVPGIRHRLGAARDHGATPSQLPQALDMCATRGRLGTVGGMRAPHASLATAGAR